MGIDSASNWGLLLEVEAKEKKRELSNRGETCGSTKGLALHGLPMALMGIAVGKNTRDRYECTKGAVTRTYQQS